MPRATSTLQIAEGLPVESFDGRRLGIVRAVEEDRFLIEARKREDFWLPEVFVRSVESSRVVLHLDASRLRRYVPAGHFGRGRAVALAVMSASVLTSLAAVAV